MADIRARIDKLAAQVGSQQANAFAPASVTVLNFTRYWGGESDAEARDERRELRQAAVGAMVDQLVSWAVDDARRHDWRREWHLIISANEDEPQQATFHLPWRGGALPYSSRELTWPEIATMAGE
jgi:hypothetical protein